jgi:hypothetical protein
VAIHLLASVLSATAALLRMSIHQGLAAWSEARQSFELRSPERAVRCCRKYELCLPLGPQTPRLAEASAAVAQEAAAGILGNLGAVGLVFAEVPGDCKIAEDCLGPAEVGDLAQRSAVSRRVRCCATVAAVGARNIPQPIKAPQEVQYSCRSGGFEEAVGVVVASEGTGSLSCSS